MTTMRRGTGFRFRQYLGIVVILSLLAGCGAGLCPFRAHLRILEEGVDVWNQWREDNPEIRPVLAYFRMELVGASLIGVNFSDTSLSSSDLSEANLESADLTDAYLDNTQLVDANLSLANLTEAYLKFTNFEGARLTGANLTDAEFLEVNLTDADLSGANLSGITGWDTHLGIVNCNITGVLNAPEGFREWALENGAIEME